VLYTFSLVSINPVGSIGLGKREGIPTSLVASGIHRVIVTHSVEPIEVREEF